MPAILSALLFAPYAVRAEHAYASGDNGGFAGFNADILASGGGRFCRDANIANWVSARNVGHYVLLRIDYRIDAPGWFDGGSVTLSFTGGESESVATDSFASGSLRVERLSPTGAGSITYTVRLTAADYGSNWCDYTVTRTVQFT